VFSSGFLAQVYIWQRLLHDKGPIHMSTLLACSAVGGTAAGLLRNNSRQHRKEYWRRFALLRELNQDVLAVGVSKPDNPEHPLVLAFVFYA
jgi:hypothetical protein